MFGIKLKKYVAEKTGSGGTGSGGGYLCSKNAEKRKRVGRGGDALKL